MVTLVFLGAMPRAFAADQSTCWDFDKNFVVTPLNEAPRGTSDVERTGTLPDETTQWAMLRGDVQLPIEKVMELIASQQIIRDWSVVELTVERQAPGPYLLRQLKRQTAKRFIFTVKWLEEWAYAVTEGTAAAPKTILISFQKTEGTAHMAHYCANVVLRRTATGTDVSMYNQARCTRRSADAELEAEKVYMQRLRDAAVGRFPPPAQGTKPGASGK